MPALDIERVRGQEDFLHRHPFLFRLKVLFFLLVGVAIFGSLAVGSLVAVAFLVLLLLSGKAWLLLAKAIKLVWVLVFPLWGMLRIGFRALCWRAPKPEGRWLKEEEAPALFAALEQMRRQMKGPRISGVVLYDDMNAFAHARPLGGFWFLFFRQHFIGLGVPLIQTLSEKEALAVVAHEYGHLSGHPSRFDAFVYRLRWRLIELYQHSAQWDDWPSRWLAKMLGWYIPRFDGLAFALCRASEFAADRIGGELIGAQPAARALMRFRVAANYIHRDFWPRIHRRVADEADPAAVRPWSQLPALVRESHDDDVAADLLRDALREETGVLDTHPALCDRLAAMRFDTEPYLIAGQSLPPVAERTAAESWFGERLPEVLADFDRNWADAIRAGWQARHTEVKEERRRRDELESRDEAGLSDDEAWELLIARINDDRVEDADAAVLQFIQQHPAHAYSRLAWGQRNLDDDEARAVKMLFEAMRLDSRLIAPACDALAAHYPDQSHNRALLNLLAQRHAVEAGQ